MISVAYASYLVGVVFHGLRTFTTDARRYTELSFDERHIFWKKVQSAAFLALMPLFLALGAVSRLLDARTLHSSRRTNGRISTSGESFPPPWRI
jgi:hypothetical protein